jgi:hypothetical protein
LSRPKRDSPLPELQPVRVEDSKTQRGFEMLSSVLRAVLQLLQPLAQPEPWQDITLYDGATVYLSKPQFRRNALGRIEMRGGATTGTTVTFGTIPVTHRPAIDQYMPATVDSAGSFVQVSTSGELSIPAGGGSSIVQMCGSFDTEA